MLATALGVQDVRPAGDSRARSGAVQNGWFPKQMLGVVPKMHTIFQIAFTAPEFKVQRQERPDP